MIIPKTIGTKSPIRLIDGVNNMGNANSTNTMAVTVMMLMDFGRCINAMLIGSVFGRLRRPRHYRF